MCPIPNGQRSNLESDVSNYLHSQLKSIFPGDDRLVEEVLPHVNAAIIETESIVDRLVDWKGRGFNKLISWQYATFLYKLGHKCVGNGVNEAATERLFLLNKALHGLELHPNIELPTCFFLSHTNSAVFAKASYSDYCVFHQGITVGRKGDKRPVMEEYVVMYPASMIIGNCHVRKNSVLAPGVRLIDNNTPGDCYVFEDGKGGVRFRDVYEIHAARFFDIDSRL